MINDLNNLKVFPVLKINGQPGIMIDQMPK